MPSYVILGNWTEEGMRALKQAPQRSEAFSRAAVAAGGRVSSMLYTIGPYDFVAIVEFPSDEVANQVILRTGMQGSARTTTLKGWTAAEFLGLVGQL
jgi:uncharacterized protein with GYD domain